MVTFQTSEGPLVLPDITVQAVARRAERLADLTGGFLQSSFPTPGEVKLPAAVLLELAAVLELGVWERQGLLEHINTDLPTYREASNQLAARCAKGSAEFERTNAAPFSQQMLCIWLEHFAWEGPEILGADMVVGEVEEDVFLDLLAEFAWTHRRELNHLLQKEPDSEET